MVSHPELSSDLPIGSDQDSGRDKQDPRVFGVSHFYSKYLTILVSTILPLIINT